MSKKECITRTHTEQGSTDGPIVSRGVERTLLFCTAPLTMTLWTEWDPVRQVAPAFRDVAESVFLDSSGDVSARGIGRAVSFLGPLLRPHSSPDLLVAAAREVHQRWCCALDSLDAPGTREAIASVLRHIGLAHESALDARRRLEALRKFRHTKEGLAARALAEALLVVARLEDTRVPDERALDQVSYFCALYNKDDF